jgi:hypothetical protein
MAKSFIITSLWNIHKHCSLGGTVGHHKLFYGKEHFVKSLWPRMMTS